MGGGDDPAPWWRGAALRVRRLAPVPGEVPAKVAAVVIAAEAWAWEGDEPERHLRLKVEMSRRAFKVDEDVDYQDRVTS